MDNSIQKSIKKKTPGLAGFSIDSQEAMLARDQKKLLSISIEINTACNLNCRYCLSQCPKKLSREIEFNKLQRIIEQSADLGAKSVIITGGGEPMLHSKFKEIILSIHRKGLIPVVFSNSIMVNAELAEFLCSNNVSVVAKIDSLRPLVQDNLAGSSGAYVKIQAGLYNLFQAGFSNPINPLELRMGVFFTANSSNIDEIEDIWHFCRRNHIYPHIQYIFPDRSENVDDLLLSPIQIKYYRRKLHSIDKKHYGYEWIPCSGLCIQHYYNMHITVNGDLRPSVYTNFEDYSCFVQNGKYPYNVFERRLSDLYQEEPFVYARNIGCYGNEKLISNSNFPDWIGCRGYAYRAAIIEGFSPFEALRISCQKCVQ